MFQADETTVPWVNQACMNRNLIGLDAQQQHAYACRDFTRHLPIENYYIPGRLAAWRGVDDVVHMTDVMYNPYSGIDRVTLCRLIRLNTHPQLFHHVTYLDIYPDNSSVTCLGCLGR